MVVFPGQDVIRDPPFTRLDLLSCRNLIIYLEPELQERLCRTSTTPCARRPPALVSLGEHRRRRRSVQALDRKWKLFRVVPSRASAGSPSRRALPRAGVAAGGRRPRPGRRRSRTSPSSPPGRSSRPSRPPSVVTDRSGNVLYVHGDTGRYLRPAPGHATLNVIELARAGLQAGLRPAFRARRRGAPRPPREAAWTSTAGPSRPAGGAAAGRRGATTGSCS